MLSAAFALLFFALWAAGLNFQLRGLGRRWTEWNGRRVFWRAPLRGNRQMTPMLDAGIEYVANYALEIRRNDPDSWIAGFTDFDRFAEISLDGVDGGRDFRAFGTAPEIARALVGDPVIRKGLQQFDDWHEALVIDEEGVRARRYIGPALFGRRALERRLFAEGVSLAVAAYDRLQSL